MSYNFLMATPYFPKGTLDKMRSKGISESEALDVFNTGEYCSTSTGSHMMEKRYTSTGYSIGLYYVLDNSTSRPVITAVWKRRII